MQSWKALEWIPQASPMLLEAGAGAAAAASETTASCWIVRGPITASTALCATALPVPKAIPCATVAPRLPSMDPPLEAEAGAGGGAWLTGAGGGLRAAGRGAARGAARGADLPPELRRGMASM
uniref:Uncharacterized protein n=1 Tax=Opuntia streptacantha TaxID=393608 RepID=A0A7C9DLB6_OPUST